MANVAVIGIGSVFMVALVVAVVVGVTNMKNKEEISSSKKAVKQICQPVTYRETCEESLSSSDSSDPKELIRVGFKAAMEELEEVLAKSETIEELKKDENTKEALKVCNQVLDCAIDDLKRSSDQLGEYEMSKINEFIMNLRVWLSATITHQQTCIDSFKEVSSESAQKMQSILQRSQELTSNSLIMVDKMATILKELKIPGYENINTTSLERRLLSAEFPDWMSCSDRRLLQAKAAEIQPNLVIAQDGSGKFDSLTKALAEIPKNSKERFIVHLKEGIYKEHITLDKSYINLVFIGDGPTKTVFTSAFSVAKTPPTRTFESATVGISGFGFMAKDIGFENSAGPEGGQAVAFRASSDLTAFYNCQFSGYQDTLYAHSYRQFYRECEISGTVDFIFGDSKTVFQNCKLIARKPMEGQGNMLTAQGKKLANEDTGFVFHNCTISGTPDYIPVKDVIKTYLGRPWKEFSKTIFMQCQIDDIITPEGWTEMNGTVGLDTCFYSEYNNRGPGANTAGRVTWKGIKKMTDVEAKTYTVGPYLKPQDWLPAYGIPFVPDMIPGL